VNFSENVYLLDPCDYVMDDNEKVECYCEVCDEKITGYTKWKEHIATSTHVTKVFKY